MKNYKIYFVSDSHYGLKSAGYDRTNEIHSVMTAIVEDAIESGADLFIHGGDIGHIASPSPEIHSLWIELFEKLEAAKIQSRFVLGNHDISNRSYNVHGSLSPLHELQYQYVKAVTRIDWESIYGGIWGILYLPYVSKRNIGKHASFDDYYKAEVDRLLFKKDDSRKWIVVTHLNVHGAETANDFLLRPSSAAMPRKVYQQDNVKLILSGHIHNYQIIRKTDPLHIVIGSPIATDFGDTGQKVFAKIFLNTKGGIQIEKIETGCAKLVELNYDLVNLKNALLTVPETIRGCGVKVKMRLTEAQAESLDIKAFENGLREIASFVRPITPVIVREQTDRPVQVIGQQSDTRIVSNWLNAKRPPDIKMIAEMATEALEG